MYKHRILIIGVFLILLSCTEKSTKPIQTKGDTYFQTAGEWKPKLNIPAKTAIIYSYDKSFDKRANSWKNQGYEIQFMTGSSWGNYPDFHNGEFDGKEHKFDGQRGKEGKMIMHGHNIPYMVPTLEFTKYLKDALKKVIDKGVTAVYLEEPEYWNFSGYSDLFKKEWENYYKTKWEAQEKSEEILYKTAQLKSHLFERHLLQLAKFTKEYSKKRGKVIKFFVPTHSVFNYSLWNIISPYSNLANSKYIDGFIGQVWTGTARTPTYYDGKYAQRTIDNAYIEYASLSALVKGSNKKMIFLTDPIEDDPNHTWVDYEKNYKATFATQLMFPEISSYEVMPWPHRIYFRAYKSGKDQKSKISKNYATQLSILINSLNHIENIKSNSTQKQIGIGISKTLMYQNSHKNAKKDDPRRANIYGICFPLLKNYIPFDFVQIEGKYFTQNLKSKKVLFLTYENMKPLSALVNIELSKWVKNGGTLIYCGDNDNDFNKINQWWNKSGFDTPLAHLLKQMNLKYSNFAQKYGKGNLLITNENPSKYVLEDKGDIAFIKKVKNLLASLSIKKNNLNYLSQIRGNFHILGRLNERFEKASIIYKGTYLDLFNSELPIVKNPTLKVNETKFLYKLDNTNEKTIVASSVKTNNVRYSNSTIEAELESTNFVNGIVCLHLLEKPKKILIDEVPIKFSWNEEHKICWIQYEVGEKLKKNLVIEL